MEEEGWLEEKGGLTFPTTTSRVYTVNKYDGSLRLCVYMYYCLASVALLPFFPLSSFHLELMKMFGRISVGSQQGCKSEPRQWVSKFVKLDFPYLNNNKNYTAVSFELFQNPVQRDLTLFFVIKGRTIFPGGKTPPKKSEFFSAFYFTVDFISN